LENIKLPTLDQRQALRPGPMRKGARVKRVIFLEKPTFLEKRRFF